MSQRFEKLIEQYHDEIFCDLERPVRGSRGGSGQSAKRRRLGLESASS